MSYLLSYLGLLRRLRMNAKTSLYMYALYFDQIVYKEPQLNNSLGVLVTQMQV